MVEEDSTYGPQEEEEGMDPEQEVDLGSVLGSKQGRLSDRKDRDGTATVGSDHSAKVVVSTGPYHG